MSEDFPLSAEIRLREEIEKLKADNVRLARRVDEVTRKREYYVEELWRAVEECIGRQQLAPVDPPARDLRRAGEEVAVALLSDTQTGKVTPTYNSEVCAERVARYAEKVIEAAADRSKVRPVKHARVALLGDMVEGVTIFPGQHHLIDSTLYDQVLNTTPVIVADFIRKLLTFFSTVEVHAVDGNHGRIGKRGEFGPADNADRMVYRIIDLMLKDEPRYKLHMNDPAGERNWWHVMQVGEWRAMMLHGDQFKGVQGIPWNSVVRKVNGWASGGLPGVGMFHDVLHGHFHQLTRVSVNGRGVYCNGSTECGNTFASEVLAAQSHPEQWLLFVDPKMGRVTTSIPMRLDI